MPRTADLDCEIFRHLTGKAKPALIYPTNTDFEPADWQAVVGAIGSDDLSIRDVMLIRVAMLVGLHNLVIRTRYTAELFAGFTPDQIAVLALANANRGYLIVREKSDAAAAAAAEAAGGRPLDLGAISQLLIEAGPGQSPATADDLNNSMIDTLPHWFALARDIPEGERPEGEHLAGLAQRAGAILSLEHSFRSIWQMALWEPWRFGRTPDGGQAMIPTDPDWMASWRIWDLREQSLHLQGAILNRQIEKLIPRARKTLALSRTVTAIDLESSPSLTVGTPDEAQADAHRMSIDALNDAYTRVFADQQVDAPGVTVDLLCRVVMVLQDLAQLALPKDYDPEDPDWKVMERLACRLPRAVLIEAVERSLAIGSALAEACIAFLTVEPLGDLGELFRIGLWHKPLVATSDGAHVLIAAGALIWGSPIRRTERWLQNKGDDLSKTPNGMIYEAATRASIADALRENPDFRAADWGVSHLPKGRAKEEIDLIVRVGSRVLVAEIKCFLGPSEPNECYNYLRKLEKAAAQARRKAAWLASEQPLMQSLVGGADELETIPLVVVNQSNGIGLEFDGCQVTDAHFLRLVLGAGDYQCGARFNGDNPIEVNVQTLYGSAEEAAAILDSVFAKHLGLQRYRQAVRWTTNDIPLAGDEGALQIAYPIVDEAAYYASGPFAELD